MVVVEVLPSSSVTSKMMFFIPGSFHPIIGLLSSDSVTEKSEVNVIPDPSIFTPSSNVQRYSTINPS